MRLNTFAGPLALCALAGAALVQTTSNRASEDQAPSASAPAPPPTSLPATAFDVPTSEQFQAFRWQRGELLDPAAVAINARGFIFVADTHNDRVVVFDRSGKQVATIGKSGSGPGELLSPQGLDVGGDDLVWVADTGNHRIQAFRFDGQPAMQLGQWGSAPGELNRPQGIAVRNERVYVADTGNHRIQVLRMSGAVELELGRYGRDPGQFIRPAGVGVDARGFIYVADTDNHRVQQFDPLGQFQRAWGDWGYLRGLLVTPTGIDVVGNRVFVADRGNHRVQVFDLSGQFLYFFGKHVLLPHEGEGHLHYPDDVAVSPRGDFAVVCEGFENRVQIFERGADDPGRRWEDPTLSEQAAAAHYGPSVSLAGTLMVLSEPESQSVQVFDVRGETPILVTQFGQHGTRLGEFSRITDVAFDGPRDQVYVGDADNWRLQIFRVKREADEPLRFIPNLARLDRSVDLAALSTRVPQLGGRRVLEPTAIAVDRLGHVFIADARNTLLLHFDANMQYLSGYAGRGSDPGKLRRPVDLALSPDGERVYVVDAENRRVQAYSRECRPDFDFGRRGEGDGEFRLPAGIVVLADGSVVVSDAGANRLQVFDAKGQFLRSWGKEGMGAGEFYKPAGMVRDESARLIVIDFGNHRGQILDPEGNFLSAFGARLYVRPTRQRNAPDDEPPMRPTTP